MTRIAAIVAALALGLALAASAAAGGWSSSVTYTNQVASSPTSGGGYPDPSGAPAPGACRSGSFDANHSESWLAVEPGTENLVGASKFFFENFSTFYNFYLGSYTIPNGTPSSDNQVQGYDCVSTGTQAMPPSWTNTTDPNVAFDDHGRVYQAVLPFNAYWTNLHPNGAIAVSYSDDLGKTWTMGNGGKLLTQFNNASSLALGDAVDKQWIAVDTESPLVSTLHDSVYAMWAVFNGFTVEVDASVSRDRGQTFSAPTRITLPNTVGPSKTAAAERFPSAATSASPSTRGIRSSPASRSAGSTSTRAPRTPSRARAATGSSATTSGSRSPLRTSTRSASRPTTRRT
jgi:hypothetical protein